MKAFLLRSLTIVLAFLLVLCSTPGLPVLALDDQGNGTVTFTETAVPGKDAPDLSDVSAKKEKAPRSKAQKKLATQLLQLVDSEMLPKGTSKDNALRQMAKRKQVTFGKTKSAGSASAQVYIKLQKDADIGAISALAKIKGQDLKNNLVVASVPVDQLEALAELDSVAAVQSVLPPVVYRNTSEGKIMHNVDDAINAGTNNGAGVKVGVISDGVDSIAKAQATGDLPKVTVLRNEVGGDEGTAMLEVIYDLAPGADLYFHDCGDDWIAFNNAIDALVAAGCTVIVDDIGWITQPFYEDGIIAKHVKSLVDSGQIIYVSSAGNAAGEHYQGNFYDDGNKYHDFSGGKDSANKQIYLTLDPGEDVIAVLQWNDVFGKSGNDYDLYMIDRATMREVAHSNMLQDGAGSDPMEILYYLNTTTSTINLAVYVKLYNGAAKNLELYLYPGYGTAVSSKNIVSANSIFGHAAVPGVITCGAIDHALPTQIESFSSRGPVTMVDGSSRQKPDVCGADGVSVTGVGGFPSHFYGTSAAAPHVAAIAALVWSQHPQLSAPQIRNRILGNTKDLGAAGYDNTYGYGLADAYSSVQYTIDFNANGGSAVASMKAPPRKTIAEPAVTRSGCTFLGWYVKPEFLTQTDPGKKWDFATDVVTRDMTLVAKWQTSECTVTFDSRGGSLIDPMHVQSGSRVPLPAAPTRAGCTFAGWFRDAACTTLWKGNSVVTGNMVLYAKWSVAAPLSPAAASASYNSVRVSWRASPAAPNISGYEIWRSTSPSSGFVLAGTVSNAALSFTSTGLATNTAYYFKMRAFDLAGSTRICGPYSAVTAAARPLPSAPATCTASSSAYNSIKIAWSAVAGASGYSVYRASSSTGTYALVTSTTATSYLNTGLSTGASYYYKVRAYRSVGGVKVYGAYSAAAQAKPALAIPASVRAVRASSSSIKVTWGKVAGASGYELWRSASSTGTYALVRTTSSLYFTNTSLSAGKWYYYKARAYRVFSGKKVYGPFSGITSAKP